MRVLVTGASGFVGRHLVKALREKGHQVRTAGLSGENDLDFRLPLSNSTDWRQALRGCDAVVHAAGKAHITGRAARDAEPFFRVNEAGTAKLARDAAAENVGRLIFISSIAARGPGSTLTLSEAQPPCPITPYGRSKLAAEQQLAAISNETGLSSISLRPPLIYGAEAGGHLRQLFEWCSRGLPLPFGGIASKRSYLSIQNLADVVLACLAAEALTPPVLNIADADTLAIPELLELICAGMDRPCRMFSVPEPMWRSMRPFGLARPFDKLAETLVVDISLVQKHLGWHPKVPLKTGIRDAAREFATARCHIKNRT